eukprot:341396_1
MSSSNNSQDTVNEKQYGAFSKLLKNFNPFQELHDVIAASIGTLLPNNSEAHNFIKIIVLLVGYSESNINGNFQTGVACSSPNTFVNNETCVLIMVPNKTKHYSQYSISNITFRAAPGWTRLNSKLAVNISQFNVSIPIHKMKLVYKSEIDIASAAYRNHEKVYDEDIITVKHMNLKVECGHMYVFWVDVIEGSFNFGLAKPSKNWRLLHHLDAKQWKSEKDFTFKSDSFQKIIQIDFC